MAKAKALHYFRLGYSEKIITEKLGYKTNGLFSTWKQRDADFAKDYIFVKNQVNHKMYADSMPMIPSKRPLTFKDFEYYKALENENNQLKADVLLLEKRLREYSPDNLKNKIDKQTQVFKVLSFIGGVAALFMIYAIVKDVLK